MNLDFQADIAGARNFRRGDQNATRADIQKEVWSRVQENASHLDSLVERVHERGESVIAELKALTEEFSRNDITSEIAQHLYAITASFETLDQAIKQNSKLLSDRNLQIAELKVCHTQLLTDIKALIEKLQSTKSESKYKEPVNSLGIKVCNHISRPNYPSQRGTNGWSNNTL